MKDLRVAIISFEHMHATSYAEAFDDIKGATLVAIAESDPERQEMIRGMYPHVPAYFDDYKVMMDQTEIDAVIICSSNRDHLPIALECAARKKHILCEKPLGPTVEISQQIIDAARTAGVTLMTAFPVRFSPSISETRQLIKSGKLGTIIGGSTSNHGTMPGGWFVEKEKSGGGAVIDHTVHVVDVLRWMMDDEVESVYAEHATRLHDHLKVEDVGQLILKFRKGAVISLDTSWSRPKTFPLWGDVKIALKGDKANATINCFPHKINHYDDSNNKHSAITLSENLDLAMVQEFVDAVREGRAPLVSGEDGLKAVEVAMAAYKAAESGKAVRI
jgi:predicted dehydrogenase